MVDVKKPHSVRLLKLLFAALPTIVFGVFTVIFSLQQDASAKATRAQDQRQADEVNRRQIFKEYIDDMKELLLHDDFERNINESLLHMRVQTLTALKHLDSVRKHDVILFLYENRLIRHGEPHSVALHGADLGGMKFIKSATELCQLPRLYLPGVYADNIIFSNCYLFEAVFEKASMVGATFDSCNVQSGNFLSANLTGARLHDNQIFHANFTGAILTRTSIRGGVFQKINLTNVDLYQSDISEELLYSLAMNSLAPNFIINSRFPNGSMTDIDVNTLIENGRAHTQCHLNSTLSWRNMFDGSPVEVINGSQLNPAAMVPDTCFYGIRKHVMAGQLCVVSQFSLLIDLEQAMLNFSALVGLKHIGDKTEILISIHFIDQQASFDYARSTRKPVKLSSFFQVTTWVHLIPPKTRSLLVTIDCGHDSSGDHFCLFSDVELFIFQKTF